MPLILRSRDNPEDSVNKNIIATESAKKLQMEDFNNTDSTLHNL